MFTRMSFDKNITAISHCSSESDSSHISQKFIDIICEEKHECDEPITISRGNTISKKNANGGGRKAVQFIQATSGVEGISHSKSTKGMGKAVSPSNI